MLLSKIGERLEIDGNTWVCIGINENGHAIWSPPFKSSTIVEDLVNSPKHYGGKDNPYESIKVIRAWQLGFSLGNTLKYICRAGKKNPKTKVQDLEKARWYLDEEIAHLKKESSK